MESLDDLPVETWKCPGERVEDLLTKLFNMILGSQKMAEEWRKCVLI